MLDAERALPEIAPPKVNVGNQLFSVAVKVLNALCKRLKRATTSGRFAMAETGTLVSTPCNFTLRMLG